MSVALDAVEQSAIDSTNIGPWDYIKELASNRALHLFEASKIGVEIVTKGLAAMGIGAGVAGTIFTGLQKLVNAENIIFFSQDFLATPGQVKNLSNKVTGWWNGSTKLISVANQVRKFVGHLGSTFGDYVDACSALKGLGVNVSSIIKLDASGEISKVVGRIGNVASATGALSRIADYFSGDVASKAPHTLTPDLARVRTPVAESKDFWNLVKDVSILAFATLALGFSFTAAAIPAVISIGLSGTILGTRMVAYYRELQLKAIDTSHPQMIAARKVLKPV